MFILSLFPGIDLFGRAFELEGDCIVRGPDKIFGQDIRTFSPPAGHFDGIIGGSPCQDFSALNRGDETGIGRELLSEYLRCVRLAKPAWFLLENVPRCPNVEIDGYKIQRIDLIGGECGLHQRRLRHFQFGSTSGIPLVIPRGVATPGESLPAATASEGRRPGRRSWADFCALQGLPPLELSEFTKEAKYRAVGNGVPIPMGRMIAIAIAGWSQGAWFGLCPCSCGCGRPVAGRRTLANAACRKRQERRRRVTPDIVREVAAV